MTPKASKAHPGRERLQQLLADDEEFLKIAVREALEEVLEAEMEETLGAAKSERTTERLGYRSGYYTRGLVKRIGKIELRLPQDRQGRFRTEVFERYQRSEKALVSALAEMYVQGVSTRKVKKITEELCGHRFSASAISAIVNKLDEQLEAFAQRRLEEPYPYLVLDARYEKVRDRGVIRSQAVLVGVGIGTDGKRSILGLELAHRESESSWRKFLEGLRKRGLQGVELVVSDDHAGLRKAVAETLTEVAWQRCYGHFLRNALDYLPRKAGDDCLMELRWIYDRHDAEQARRDLARWLEKWAPTYPKLCDWAEANIEQTWTFLSLPRQHHKHMKSTNMLERLMEEIKRRTLVVRIFPNQASCLRLVRALTAEIHDGWIEADRYLDMTLLEEHKRERLRALAEAA